MNYEIRILEDIGEIKAEDWNALGVAPYPFLRHEFLHALEQTGCLGQQYGWLPRHIVIRDQRQTLLAASPMYLKFNSYGEFVFDWAWADAFQRNGLAYYPKLVSASPYTPATGPKLLLSSAAPAELRELLIETATALCRASHGSSIHWLFTPDDETDWLASQGYLRRTGCQFHWSNRGWRDFNDFLGSLSHAKRKNIRRERRHTSDAGMSFRWLDGHQATSADWSDFHQLYKSTFDRKGGIPTLSLAFFEQIAARMPNQVLLVQALHEEKVVAAAFNLVGEHTLYGRHWGCRKHFQSLHFETCYYQGLEYCIQHGLQTFEPGAQGEYKISRGFLPKPTWSAHWLADEQLSHAVQKFLEHETGGMQEYMHDLAERSPFKQTGPV